METIRWGIIGCGNVTEVKSGPGLQKVEHSTLQAVMRRNSELAEDYAIRHHVPDWYSDAKTLIQHPEVDAIYVATPPESHKEYVLMCAQAGKPVYVEKPMALNTAECEEMIQACESAGVPLFVAYYRRALPRFMQIKKWIEEGLIGEVRLVTVTHYQPPTEEERSGTSTAWRLNPAISGGGKFVDLASHTLDILDFILGPIKEAHGTSSNQGGLYDAEDIVTAHFRFDSGVHGMGHWYFSAFEREEMNEIVGSHGKIRFSTFGNEPVLVVSGDESFETSFEPPQHIQQPLIQCVVNALNKQGDSPSTGITALRTNRVMDAIYGV
jgi:1,5-anhydro-D-fructose reductase (1,5-anhydro-D-mannitol-forming)